MDLPQPPGVQQERAMTVRFCRFCLCSMTCRATAAGASSVITGLRIVPLDLKSRHRDRVFGRQSSIAAGCQCKSSIMYRLTSRNECKQCRESNLLVVGCMAAVLEYDVEGRCH